MTKARIDIGQVAKAALARPVVCLSRWLPGGKQQGTEYLSLNPTRPDSQPGSFSVNVQTGRWADFATGDKGGDLVSLVAYLDGVSQSEAARRLADVLGVIRNNGDSGEGGDNATKTSITKRNQLKNQSGDKAQDRRGQTGTKHVSRETPLPAVPAQASAPPAAHPRHGRPVAIWNYKNEAGELLAYVCRFEPKGSRKQIIPLTYWPDEGWRWKGLPTPRPLYNLDQFTQQPSAPVIVCEGEKAADAAARLLPEYVTTTAMNGAQSPTKADWSPLKGRRVLVWPDADEPGALYAQKVCALAAQADAESTAVLDLKAFTKNSSELPKGWDAADAEAEGWTTEQVQAALVPAKPTHQEDRELRPYFEPTERGVYYHGVTTDRHSGEPARQPPLWICSALYVEAYTRDEHAENWGRLLEFTDRDGNLHVWAMPMHLLRAGGEELRGELLRLGLEITTHQNGRRLLGDYLQQWRPEARARCVQRTGWHSGVYALPDRTIGKSEERVIFQSDTLQGFAYAQRGTLQDWITNIAQPCAGNSRLVFAVSVALASVLLEVAGDESGGFHLRGGSSTGKTTALRVAASVFGSAEFLQRWRATDNGLEAMAEQHNDALLILDELAQVDPKAAGETAYMLANGSGKARADRGGFARAVRRWRMLFLSAGEVGLAEHMAQAGKRAKAGQEIRMADIPADTGTGLGVFETLHNYPNGAALSRALTDAANETYGNAALTFIEAIQRHRSALATTIKQARAEFVTEAVPTSGEVSGQVQRVASRFGLVAVAGELATTYGVTGWQQHEATRAAHICFAAWLDARGGVGDQEEAVLVRQVRHFFELHGEARFSSWERAQRQDDHAPRTSNRAGFVRLEQVYGTHCWYVLPNVFRTEICDGFDYRWAEGVLVKHHLMKPGNDGRGEQRKEQLPGFKSRARCYVFDSSEWET